MNRFYDEETFARSRYAGEDEQGKLVFPLNSEIESDRKAAFLHAQFKALIAQHSCSGAKAAFGGNTYRMGFYDQMGDSQDTRTLCYDLVEFLKERDQWGTQFSTFIAVFDGPYPTDEEHFEKMLWQQLAAMRRLEGESTTDNSPTTGKSDNSAFRFNGRDFFVVGLSPCASRLTRRFAYPCLVFNLKEQFDELRTTGEFEKLQRAIRRSEERINGSINPNLSLPDTHQFSGRQVGEDWQPPNETPDEVDDS